MKRKHLLIIGFCLCMSIVFGVCAEEIDKPSYGIQTETLTGIPEDLVLKEIASLYPGADVWSVFHSEIDFDIKPRMTFRFKSNDTYLSFSNYSLLLLYTDVDGERKNFKLGNSMIAEDGSVSFRTYDEMCEALKGVYAFDLAIIKDL